MPLDIRSVILVHRGRYPDGVNRNLFEQMLDWNSAQNKNSFARNICEVDEIEMLKEEINSGSHIIFRYVCFDLNFHESEEQKGIANEYIRWLGWNNIAWHMRDFSTKDSAGATPQRAPVAGLWPDVSLTGSPLAEQLCRTIIFYMSENAQSYAINRPKNWSEENGFQIRHNAPMPDHHIFTFDPVKSNLSSQHSSALTFPTVLFVQESEDLARNIRSGIRTPIIIYSLRDQKPVSGSIPQTIIDMIEDDAFAPGRYALLSDHKQFDEESVETLSEDIGGIPITIRRVTYCVGAETQSTPKFVTAWVFERPAKLDQQESSNKSGPNRLLNWRRHWLAADSETGATT